MHLSACSNFCEKFIEKNKMADGASLIEPHFAFVWDCKKVDRERSSSFKFQQKEFYFQFFNSWNETSNYRLRLIGPDDLPEPFDVWVHLIVGEDSLSHCTNTATVRQWKEIIWQSKHSDLSKIVPDFENKPFRFIIVSQSGAAASQDKTGNKSVQTPTYLDPKFQLEKLSEDFGKLLNGEEDSSADVELVCGDRTWKAHRSLLSSRSDVFRTMLQSDMLEKKTGRVEVRDSEAVVFGQFLQHLYTGKLPELTVENAMSLYEIGDRYSVGGIKERCASFLTDNLTRDNACSILDLAERHSDQTFRHSVISYVLNEKIPLNKEHWSDFCNDHPRLANEIYGQFLQLHISKLT